MGHLQEQTEEMMSKQWGSGGEAHNTFQVISLYSGQRLPDQKEIQNVGLLYKVRTGPNYIPI